jgi:hypothetical protein
MATLAAGAITAARNGAANAVAALVDAGSGAGRIRLLTAGSTLVATCIGQDPFFAAASGGTATQSGSAVDSNATGNASAVTQFQLRDSDNNDVITGTVAESAADINIDDGSAGGGVIIEAGATVTLTGIAITFNLV